MVDLEALAEHTPGPYVQYKPTRGTGNYWVEHLPEGSIAFETMNGAGAFGQAVFAVPRYAGTARLLAAAPDLLAEVRELRARVAELTAEHHTLTEERDVARNRVAELEQSCRTAGDVILVKERRVASLEVALEAVEWFGGLRIHVPVLRQLAALEAAMLRLLEAGRKLEQDLRALPGYSFRHWNVAASKAWDEAASAAKGLVGK